jgi:hypothetical protein
VAAEIFVVNLKTRHRAAKLTPPTVEMPRLPRDGIRSMGQSR